MQTLQLCHVFCHVTLRGSSSASAASKASAEVCSEQEMHPEHHNGYSQLLLTVTDFRSSRLQVAALLAGVYFTRLRNTSVTSNADVYSAQNLDFGKKGAPSTCQWLLQAPVD